MAESNKMSDIVVNLFNRGEDNLAVGNTLYNVGGGLNGDKKMPVDDAPSREEVNAKLEAVEARIDGKLAGIAADIKIVVSGQASMRDDIKDVRRDIGSYKTAVIVTGVAIVAMMLGFLAFGVQILELASGLFEAGASK